MAQAQIVDTRPSYDPRLLTLILSAVMVGLVMAFSASYPAASRPGSEGIPGDAFRIVTQHALYALVGLGLMAILSYMRPVWFHRLAAPAVIVTFTLTGLCLFIGHQSHGATQWLQVGPWRFQPSEFAKVALVVFIASRLSLGKLSRENLKTVGLPIMAVTGFLCLLLTGQGDQGMSILVFVMTLAICFVGGYSLWRILGWLVVGGAGATVLAFTSPERAQRILAWLNPVKYRTGAGFHILAMLVTTARGFIGGLGLGMSPDKWRQLPEAHTDSIFCVLGGELGLLGCGLFLLLMGWIIVRCFQIGRWSRDPFGYFLAVGVGTMLGLQALINLFVATDLMPVTGLTLPYISYGGSSLIACLMAAGMVLSVSRYNPPLRRKRSP